MSLPTTVFQSALILNLAFILTLSYIRGQITDPIGPREFLRLTTFDSDKKSHFTYQMVPNGRNGQGQERDTNFPNRPPATPNSPISM